MSLFPKRNKFDIYIYVPPYKRASAGVTVLYLLCDYLNRIGFQSWIVPDIKYFGIFGYSFFSGSSSLITPVLSYHSISRCVFEGRIPIVIYPETIQGNPLGFDNIVRYLLYYNSELSNFDALDSISNEGVIYYSNKIGEVSLEGYGVPRFQQRLTLPVQDPKIYANDLQNRSGVYYYAEKYINVHALKVPDEVSTNARRITRDQADSPTPEELVKILSTAKMLHVFEDTALIYEALLAGCVVNIHPDGRYSTTNGPATTDELGLHGTISKRNVLDSDIESAKLNLKLHAENYKKWMDLSIRDIEQFTKNINVFELTYSSRLKKRLYTVVDNLNRYDKSIAVSNGFVYRKSMYSVIVRTIKKCIPNSVKKPIINKLKIAGRNCPPSIKPYLIKLFIMVSR